jgi:uncharacterized protein YndB with AHSA1/START domain
MMKNRTTVERRSDRELVVTRTINGPARLVFEAWTKAELFQKWWVPKSAPITLISCELDARTGGRYKLVFTTDGTNRVEFFGKYIEVTPHSRMVWTNDEAHGAGTVTTVTFEEKGGQTLLTVHDVFPSKEALESDGAVEAMPETLDQLDALVVALGSKPSA